MCMCVEAKRKVKDHCSGSALSVAGVFQKPAEMQSLCLAMPTYTS